MKQRDVCGTMLTVYRCLCRVKQVAGCSFTVFSLAIDMLLFHCFTGTI